ncbi:hypothetical protein K7X08_035677 [Anisodus acutangulus]|uniref:Uncharacterized protein n=1 Tax=Anisodus acutangulus TaxID=402998 RepID=A0A9Q1MCP3_9SOLA|nr:hypothetical protein K7X08_035677 [Anisodus acutangulus]
MWKEVVGSKEVTDVNKAIEKEGRTDELQGDKVDTGEYNDIEEGPVMVNTAYEKEKHTEICALRESEVVKEGDTLSVAVSEEEKQIQKENIEVDFGKNVTEENSKASQEDEMISDSLIELQEDQGETNKGDKQPVI